MALIELARRWSKASQLDSAPTNGPRSLRRQQFSQTLKASPIGRRPVAAQQCVDNFDLLRFEFTLVSISLVKVHLYLNPAKALLAERALQSGTLIWRARRWTCAPRLWQCTT